MIAFENIFQEFAVLLLIASLISAVILFLRQPLVVAYILVGILVGPSVFGIITFRDEVDLLAQIGISVLLFVVGLKLDLHLIRTMGAVALATGLGQVIFTSVIGYLLAVAMGFAPVTAIYIAVALTFSSTIIIVKLLSDKREIDALHGRIAVGFLIVQDIVVVLVMIGLTTFGSPYTSAERFWSKLLLLLLKGSAFIVSMGLLMRYVLPRLLHHLASSRELLVLFSISWAVSLAVAGEMLGFSKEIGAFVAGISLASTPYREAIGTRLVNLRDFLLLFFFLDLGAKLNIQQLGVQAGHAVVFSLFVLIGNPLIVMIIMGAMGYRKRTSFLAGLTVAQISEFSLILASLGVSLGHIGTDTLGLITLVGLITIGISTYMILYSHPLYKRLSPRLKIFEKKVRQREDTEGADKTAPIDVILFGMGRYGSNLAHYLTQRGLNVLGVDFDPETVALRNNQGFRVCYGDAEDPECVLALPLNQTKWIISTIPQLDINLSLLDAIKQHGYHGRKAFTSHSEYDTERLKQKGADMILSPFFDAAKEAADRIVTLVSEKDKTQWWWHHDSSVF